jgi:hypothetical protein
MARGKGITDTAGGKGAIGQAQLGVSGGRRATKVKLAERMERAAVVEGEQCGQEHRGPT